MNVTRVRVVADRLHPKASYQQQRDNLDALIRKYRSACKDAAIVPLYKEHAVYEKPSDKKRRLKKERELQQSKQNMVMNFQGNRSKLG